MRHVEVTNCASHITQRVSRKLGIAIFEPEYARFRKRAVKDFKAP